jgi:predicted transcriptional regulator of viral defense system
MSSNVKKENRSVSDYVDHLQSRGQYTFSTKSICDELPKNRETIRVALNRLSKKGRIVKVKKGFYVIVTLEYQSVGCPPATWFIDDLMTYMEQEYYMGILSAAEFYGAAHQRPQVFQVITDTQTDPVRVEGVGVNFHTRKHIEEVPVQKENTRTGTVRVSTPESTAYDLFLFAHAAAGLDNIANVLIELSEELDREELVNVAQHVPYHSIIQRFGYVMEFIGQSELVSPLADWISEEDPSRVKLHPGRPYEPGNRNKKWDVIVNYEINPDL